MKKKLVVLTLAACLMASAAVCGAENKESEVKMETRESDENVIATSVAVVEILDALHVPMVGVPTSSYELPESVADAERIGNPMSPDLEVITSLSPDYIISVKSLEEELSESLKSIETELYFADLSSYDGLKTAVSELGGIFHKEDEASEILEELNNKEENVTKNKKEDESQKVLVIFGAGDSFMAATESSYVGDLLRITGAENIAQVSDAMSGFVPMDMEYLAEQNPDCILLMVHANPEESLEALKNELENNPAWKNFDSVINDNIHVLEPGKFGMSANLQAGEALEELSSLIYGESTSSDETQK